MSICVCSDPWCPDHARCGGCGGDLIILDGDPAFCQACGHDVMPARACAHPRPAPTDPKEA